MKKRNSRGSNKFLIILVILVAAFAAGLYFLKTQPVVEKKVTSEIHNIVPKEKKPKFDFYTILPQEKNGSSSSGAKNANPILKTAPKVNNKKMSNSYLLQIASVKKFSEADRLKAELTLLGFNVIIQKTKVGNAMWNRVNVGPYNSLDAAQVDQMNLKKNNFDSIMIKIPLD